MKVSRRIWLAVLGLEVALLALALWAYPRLPEAMVTHWGLQGKPDGWMPRFWGVVWGPALTALLALVYYVAIPWLEPWRENLQRFWDLYQKAGLVMLYLLALPYAATLLWNLGYPVDIRRVVGVTLAPLFWVLASLLAQARPNWFVGIRTPWTLSSPWVWHRTHAAAARWMRVLALGYFLAVLWPPLLMAAVGLTLVWAVGVTVYSFLLYRRRAGEPV